MIGIPDEYEDSTLPGWETQVNQFFKEPGDEAIYDYDFGDGWRHKILMEGIHLQESDKKYPSCIDGRRACPPEDCGGAPGYYRLLNIIKNKTDEEHEDTNYWLKNHAKNYYPYDAEQFSASEVKFWNPKKRFKMAFQNHG
ncbi:hypothetical protein JCM17961_01780 [Endothiovibrio diazotrophicus]